MIPKGRSASFTALAPALANPLRWWMLLGMVLLAPGLTTSPPIRAQAPPTTLLSSPSFEVATIKPNKSGAQRVMIMFRPGRFEVSGATVKEIIAVAYDVKDFQISGGPGWITSERYDIQAKVPDSLAEQLQKLPGEQRAEPLHLLVQGLLADRFKLKLHHDTKELPVYALVVGKNGPKLQEAKSGETYANGMKAPDGHPAGAGMMRIGPGQLTGQGVPIVYLLRPLSQILGRPVLDQTGLKGKYDIALQWAPDPNQGAPFRGLADPRPGADNPPPPDSTGPSIFTAIQEQLGLKLESQKGPVDMIVIDHVEPPSEN